MLAELELTSYGQWTPGGLIGYQEPPVQVISPFTKSRGEAADQFFEKVGIKLDPWQRHIFFNMLGRREDMGKWSSRTVGLVIARQNGKTEIAAARILFGLYVLKEKLIIYTAHRNDTAHAVFERVEELIENSAFLKSRTKSISHTNGREGVKTTTNCAVMFKTRKKNSGRGFSCDCLIVDEAMDCDRQFVRDAEKATSARLDPQIIYMGSAGTQESLAFGDKRSRALSDSPGLISWFEWSIEKCDYECEEDCQVHLDPHSVEAYRRTNPAYGIRIDHETIEEEWLDHQNDIDGFLIERLSIGDWPVSTTEFGVISKEDWEAAKLESNFDGKIIFSVSMSPNRTDTVITAVGYADDQQHDLVIHVLSDSARGGTLWVAERLEELYYKWSPYGIVIDSRGQASTLIETLEEKGIPVYSPSSLEYAQSCALFAIGVSGTKKEKPYIHHIGDTLLTAAVAGAGTRNLSGLWAWARADEHSNIVALEAATLGVWGFKKAVKEASMNTVYFRRAKGVQ